MKLNAYQKTAITTVGATIFLIFVGALVRASGSGLGCPDWPKCFGHWMPPTSAADLPSGFDASQFNIFKTWTEYVNRLVGVTIGLLITATALLSFRYRDNKSSVTYSSVAAFVLVLFQGWLGGQVVKTGLNEWLITVHMLLAMAIMTLLLFAVFKATEKQWSVALDGKTRKWLFSVTVLLFVFTMIQMILGTEVREAVDGLAASVPRASWLTRIGHIDEFHRSFSWTVFLSSIGLVGLTFKMSKTYLLKKGSVIILGLVIIQIGLGVGLYYLDLPPVYQVLHLLGVAVLICAEFLFLLITHPFRSAGRGVSSELN